MKKNKHTFDLHEFYMHEKSNDIAIEVVKIVESNEDRVKFYANQWNLGWSGRPWRIDVVPSVNPILVIIYAEDFKLWKHIDHDALINPRLKLGPPV